MSKLADRFDFGTLAHLLFLGFAAVTFIYSATRLDAPQLLSGPAGRHLLFIVVGIVVYVVTQRVDYHVWADLWFILYLSGLGLLGGVLVLGRRINGARAWFELGPIRFQPSEPMKTVTVIAVAVFLTKLAGKLDLLGLIKLGLLIATPLALILMQPDMGTALTYMPLAAAGAWLAGIRSRVVVALVLIVALLAPLGWFHLLKEYQKDRILNVFDPSRDPNGSGYQVMQSRIAVGSGGANGKGLFQGSQSRLAFLPARETDFVMAVVAEETGFIGVIVVLGVYLSLIFRAIQTALTARDRLGTFLAAGVASIWACQVFINTGMVTGILPTIGVPLPILSYGGSSVIATFLAFGLVGSVRAGRIVNA